jgi:hypothetical protein
MTSPPAHAGQPSPLLGTSAPHLIYALLNERCMHTTDLNRQFFIQSTPLKGFALAVGRGSSKHPVKASICDADRCVIAAGIICAGIPSATEH